MCTVNVLNTLYIAIIIILNCEVYTCAARSWVNEGDYSTEYTWLIYNTSAGLCLLCFVLNWGDWSCRAERDCVSTNKSLELHVVGVCGCWIVERCSSLTGKDVAHSFDVIWGLGTSNRNLSQWEHLSGITPILYPPTFNWQPYFLLTFLWVVEVCGLIF